MRQKKTSINLVVLLILVSLMMPTSLFDISSSEESPQYLIEIESSVRAAADPSAFISIWDTTLNSTGSSASNQIRLPLESNGVYDFTVAWGDGSSNNTITSWDQAEVTHTYDSTGTYTVNITGIIQGWRFNGGGDRLKLGEIQQWGALRVGNAGSYFYGCENLNLTSTDALDLTGTTTLYQAFLNCTKFGSSGNLNDWDVSSVTDMSQMFYRAYSFNLPLNNWDVSSVTDMSRMFSSVRDFNQSLNAWNVSSVTDMNRIFFLALDFNQPLNDWDVSSVTDMSTMFSYSSFNQPLDAWDVSSVTSMWYLFNNALSFNQPLDAWDVSSVTDMGYVFYNARSFNQPLDAWDVSSVVNMREMFHLALSFNQPLDAWNVSSVVNMRDMFNSASSFNQPLASWDVSSVTDMGEMFHNVILQTSIYDEMLLSWSQLSLQSWVAFDAGSSRYSAGPAETAHEMITDMFDWTITDGGQEPAAPNALIVNEIEGPSLTGNITITWNRVEDAIFYRIYRSSLPIIDVSGLTAIIAGLTDTSYNDTGLPYGIYYYVVVATNYEGDFPLSNCEKVVVIIKTVSVENPNASTSWTTDSFITIEWSTTGSISHVHIDLYRNGSFVMRVISETPNDDGKYWWMIPSDLVGSDLYQIKILDASNASIFCFSAEFEIINSSDTEGSSISGYSSLFFLSVLGGIAVLIMLNRRKTT